MDLHRLPIKDVCAQSDRCFHAEATFEALAAMGDTMTVAAIVGVPVFFVLMITIGPTQDSFSGLGSMLDQVASYQLVGAQ